MTLYLNMRSTSNRVDCYSVIGIAREVAATFDKPFVPPVVTETGDDDDVNNYIKVTVKDPKLCPRYCARVVKNIKISSIAGVDAEKTGICRYPSDQQSG